MNKAAASISSRMSLQVVGDAWLHLELWLVVGWLLYY